MSKNNEKWDRSGFNELIREDKQKAFDFKKTGPAKNNKDMRINDRLQNFNYNETHKKHFPNSIHNQASVKLNHNESLQELNKVEHTNKSYNNYFNFKPKRRKNNPTDSSLERIVPDKNIEEGHVNCSNNDNNQTIRNNLNINSNFNNLKRNNYYKGNNRSIHLINLDYDGKKKLFNRNKNFYQKGYQDNDLYRQHKAFVPHEALINSPFLRNPQIFNSNKNSFYPNFNQYGFEPVLYNNSLIHEEFQPLQTTFIENALKNEVNNEMTINKKPFKKYVEEIVKSNDKKSNFKLNLNSTYIPNYSKAKSPSKESIDQIVNNLEKMPYNYNEKIGPSMYPLMNNEYNNMMYTNYPSFFPFNPMYNPQNLNLFIPNKSLNEQSNYMLPHQDKCQNYYYHNSINNYYNYLNCTQSVEAERENLMKNIDTHNTTFTTITTRTDLVNSSFETKEQIEDEKEAGKDEKNESLDLSIIEEEKTELQNDRKRNVCYNSILVNELSSLREDIILIVNVKVMHDVNSTLVIKRNDDILTVTKTFCQSNNISEPLSRAIYIKVLSGLSALKDLNENELSDNMLGLIKKAYSIYKDSSVSLDDIVVNEQPVNKGDANDSELIQLSL